MGEIDLYSERVGPERLQAPRVFSPSGNPAAGLARGVEDVGAGVDRIHLQRDTVAAKDADFAFRNKLLELGQSKGGYFTRKGKDATDSWDGYDTSIQSAREEALRALPTNRARRIAEASLDQSLLSERERGVRHYQTQLNAYEDTVDAGLITTHTNGAALVATLSNEKEVGEFRGHLEAIAALIRGRADRNGIDVEEVITAEIRKAQSDAVEGAVNTAALSSSADMLGVIQAFGGALTGDALSRVRQAYSSQLLKETAIDTADEIFASSATPAQMEAKIAPLPSTIRNEVRALVAARQRAVRTARNADRDERAQGAWALLQQGVPTKDGGVRPFTMADIPNDIRPSQTSALRAEVRRNEKGATSSTPGAILEAFSLSDAQLQNPDFDPTQYRGHLSQQYYSDFEKRVATARRGETTKYGRMSQDDANTHIGKIAKSLAPGTGPVATQRQAAFILEAKKQLSLLPDASFEDLDKILARLSRVSVDNTFGADVFAFEEVTFEDVPDAEAEEITRIWEATGNRAGIPNDAVANRYTLAQKTGLSYVQIETAMTLARHEFGHELSEMELLTFADEMSDSTGASESEVMRRVLRPSAATSSFGGDAGIDQAWAEKYGYSEDAVARARQDALNATGFPLSEEEFAEIAAAQRAAGAR